MCGDFDDNAPNEIEARLYAAFQVHAKLLLNETTRARHEPGSVSDYADRLMGDALNRALRDSMGAEEEIGRAHV